MRFLSMRFAFVIDFRTFGLISIVPFLSDTEAKSNIIEISNFFLLCIAVLKISNFLSILLFRSKFDSNSSPVAH